MDAVTQDLKHYRALVWAHWKPIVLRGALKSYERDYVASLYADHVPVSCVIAAIDRTVAGGGAFRSLGVIRYQLSSVLRERAKLAVGSQSTSTGEFWTLPCGCTTDGDTAWTKDAEECTHGTQTLKE